MKLEKWFPLQGERAHSLNFCLFVAMYANRKEEEEGETEQQLQSYQFTQGYITLHGLRPPPNTNFYHTQSILCQHSIYIHTYIYNIMNCSIHNAFY